MNSFEVIKANGDRETFKLSKLRQSLTNAGAQPPVIKDVINNLEEEGYFIDGITTKKIYKAAYDLLRDKSDHVAGRYKLKEALFELGPSGFPFELLVSEIFNRLGYKTKVGEIVQGKCVSHEIDVIAEDDDSVYMIECKFHNRQSHKSTVTTPLYIHSRFLDVHENWKTQPHYQDKTSYGYVVTNTRFTSDALDYAQCVNLKLLSWDYPLNTGLKHLIERTKLHPITSLSSLTKKEKQLLLDNKIIHCKQILDNQDILKKLHLSNVKRTRITSEATSLLNE
ncbi:MAG: restriction endonuclease [Balneolaceae bacterium]